MKKMVKYLGVVLLVGLTACTLKYEALKDTSFAQPAVNADQNIRQGIPGREQGQRGRSESCQFGW